jgi:hypothetical protein
VTFAVTPSDLYWADPDAKVVFRRSSASGLVDRLIDFPVVVNELLVVDSMLYVALPSALWAHDLTSGQTNELLTRETGVLAADGQNRATRRLLARSSSSERSESPRKYVPKP